MVRTNKRTTLPNRKEHTCQSPRARISLKNTPKSDMTSFPSPQPPQSTPPSPHPPPGQLERPTPNVLVNCVGHRVVRVTPGAIGAKAIDQAPEDWIPGQGPSSIEELLGTIHLR